MPDFGFSATFPIINREKGILSLHYDIPGEASKRGLPIASFDAGLREKHMVSQDAHAVIAKMKRSGGPLLCICCCKSY